MSKGYSEITLAVPGVKCIDWCNDEFALDVGPALIRSLWERFDVDMHEPGVEIRCAGREVVALVRYARQLELALGRTSDDETAAK